MKLNPEQIAVIRRGPELDRLVGRNGSKADIVVYRHAQCRIAVKDYRPRAWWVRQSLGRWLTARESRAYRRLQGVPGVAPFLGKIDALALATQWVDATPLRDLRTPPTSDSLAELESVLSSIHTHGVALGDLHHRDVLLDANGRVTIVDFATAWCPRSGDPLRSRVFRRMRDQDLVGLARMKQRYWGIPADVAFADCPPKAIARYRRSRNWKSRWQRLRGRSGS